MILLAAYYALLFQQSGQEDLIVGTPVPGRRGNPHFERVLGTFINVLALRATLSRGLSFRDLLQNISTVVREARDHQEFPFPLLVEKLRLPRDSSRTPIFQGYFTLQRLAVHQERLAFFLPFRHDPPLKIQAGGVTWGTVPVAQQEGQMELAVHVYDVNGELFPEFKYNTALFHRETVEGMARSYLVILQRMLRDLDWSLADLATMKQ
jgi:non-ribosomal peptide synthetase component F